MIQNKFFENMEEDFLFHFGFGTKTMDMSKFFGDTKFVCAGGSVSRMRLYAENFAKECKLPCPENLSKNDRFVLYKTGAVIWVNHGMGNPSLSIMLVEMLKLLHHAKARDVKFVRVGTCGGVGVEPGTVVITTKAINGELKEKYVQWIAGKKVERDTYLDEGFRNNLVTVAEEVNVPIQTGLTLCCDEFYEAQMRLDSFLREYTPQERATFIQQLYDRGVRNIEMESTGFAAVTHRAGYKAAVVCVAQMDLLLDDQCRLDRATLVKMEERPYYIVTRLIKKELGY